MAIGWFVLGAASWTASEYAIHRFVGHGPKRAPVKSLLARLTPKGLAAEFNREHLAHHTDPSYFAPTERKVLAAGAAIPTLAGTLMPFVGPRRALSFALGFAAMYGTYEVIHRRIHTHPPKGPYGRWARRHHLYHHYQSPRANHGVTSSAWDHAFATSTREQGRDTAPRIRVPRRSAPQWLLDEDGEVKATYAEDYELVGTPVRDGASARVTSAVAPACAG